MSAATVDGIAECSFSRGPTVVRNINGGNVEFNLETTKFYLLQAKGEYFSFSKSIGLGWLENNTSKLTSFDIRRKNANFGHSFAFFYQPKKF